MTATPVTPPSDSDSPSSSTLNISSANLNPSTSLPAASADDSFDLSDSEMADDSALASAPQAIDASSGSDNDADVAEESTTAPSASGQAGAGPSKRVRGLRPPGGPKGKLGGASSGAGGGMFGRLTGWGNKGKGRAEKDDGAGGGGGLGLSSGGAGGGGGGLREEREKLVDEDEMDALNRGQHAMSA